MKKKGNLHIVTDEKFIDSAWRAFSKVDQGVNHFIILGKKAKLKFIKKAPVFFIHPRILSFFINLVPIFYKSVIFHSIPNNEIKNLIPKLSKSIKILWISWGYDLYPLVKGKSFWLKPETKKILNFKTDELTSSDLEFNQKFLSRINFISCVHEGEFDFLRMNYSLPNVEYLPWNYLTIEEDVIFGFEDARVSGDNLMIGNNGNDWNNHLDSFTDLKDFDFRFDTIICPLSYGDNNYIKIVSEKAADIFDAKFKAILDFLPYNEYVKILVSCKYLFINSRRQLALGNILLMLYLGAYIILDKENPSYQFFMEKGIKVYTIEEAKRGEFLEINLADVRNRLIQIWGKETILRKTKTIIEILR